MVVIASNFLTVSSSPSSLAPHVLRCFETCAPAKEAARAVAQALVARMVQEVERLTSARDQVAAAKALGDVARAMLCFKDVKMDQGQRFLPLLGCVRAMKNLPIDTKLNLFLCMLYEVAGEHDGFADEVNIICWKK